VKKKTQTFSAYILECADGTLYAGWTTDVKRRVAEHNESSKGAKYTKARRPVVLKYTEIFKTKSEAQKKEWALKQLTRVEKLKILRSYIARGRIS
jgi:putative endonuclease